MFRKIDLARALPDPLSSPLKHLGCWPHVLVVMCARLQVEQPRIATPNVRKWNTGRPPVPRSRNRDIGVGRTPVPEVHRYELMTYKRGNIS